MQLVIPMTGLGSRFIKAGYERLKPFILIHEKPLIYWVLKMFPSINSENIIFILKKEHYETLPYIKSTLGAIAPLAKIRLIDNPDPRGPVPNILQASTLIDDTMPTFVSYCDFYMHWDFRQYVDTLHQHEPEGAIPCYTGFHPHLISSPNLYACCKVGDNNQLLEVREKFSFTQDKTKSLHSPGVYYFKNGALLKKYFALAMQLDLSTNGEFYASLPFNVMVKDQLKVLVTTNVEHFCQWGTPEDLKEYLACYELLLGKKDSTKAHISSETIKYWKRFFESEGHKT